MTGSKGDIVRDGAGAIMAGLGALLASHMGFSPDMVTGLSAVGGIAGLLGFDSIARRGEPYFAAFRRELHEQNEGDFDAQVRERAKDPKFRNLIYQALRQLRDAIDDAVAPALGVLTADYTVPEVRPPDAFFRGASGLLRDLTSDEYGDLVVLAINIVRVDQQSSDWLAISTAEVAGRAGRAVITEGKQYSEQAVFSTEVDAPTRCNALCDMLKRHGLARERPDTWGGTFLTSSGQAQGVTVRALVDVTDFRKLHSVLKRAEFDELLRGDPKVAV